MILTGLQIQKEQAKNKIKIYPFNANHITTNSFDLTLGDILLKYESNLIDSKIQQPYREIKIGEEGFSFQPGEFVLGHSVEKIGSDHYVPIIHARSGIARLGLFVHVTADLIDIGYYGQITFQLYATLPVRIHANMRIGQVTFWKPKGDIVLYNGKYKNSEGPRPSEIYKDFS